MWNLMGFGMAVTSIRSTAQLPWAGMQAKRKGFLTVVLSIQRSNLPPSLSVYLMVQHLYPNPVVLPPWKHQSSWRCNSRKDKVGRADLNCTELNCSVIACFTSSFQQFSTHYNNLGVLLRWNMTDSLWIWRSMSLVMSACLHCVHKKTRKTF